MDTNLGTARVSLGLGYVPQPKAGRCLECPKQRLLDNLDHTATPLYPLLDNPAPVHFYTDDTHCCDYFDCYLLYTYPTSRRPQTAPIRERLLSVAGNRD